MLSRRIALALFFCVCRGAGALIMFDFLLEDEAAPPPAAAHVVLPRPPAPAAPIVAPAPDRAFDPPPGHRTRGRTPGFIKPDSQILRHRMSFSKANSLYQRKALAGLTAASTAPKVVSALASTVGDQHEQSDLVFVAGDTAKAHRQIEHSRCGPLLERGVVSHSVAQAEGVASMVRVPDTYEYLSMSAFDDASMWVAMALAESANKERVLQGRPEKLYMARANSVWMPVLNITESTCAVQLYSIKGTEIISPAQPLPTANASTVRNRLHNWSTCFPGGTGERVDPTRCIDAACVESGVWRTSILVRDNLLLNHALVSLDTCILDKAFEKSHWRSRRVPQPSGHELRRSQLCVDDEAYLRKHGDPRQTG